MITFDLKCGEGHSFEGWFEDYKSFKLQRDNGLVVCPYCNSSDITKLISTFSTRQVSSKASFSDDNYNSNFREYLNNNFEDVGTDFTKEALKMHYGVVGRRNIRGVSSPEEEKRMNSEGVKYLKFSLFPKKE